MQLQTTYLKERILLFRLEPVGAEKFETAKGFLNGQTDGITLEKFEHVFNADGLEVDFLLVVQVLSAKLDCIHVDLGIYPEISICAYRRRKNDTNE